MITEPFALVVGCDIILKISGVDVEGWADCEYTWAIEIKNSNIFNILNNIVSCL
jgi:hypothetical protein